MSIDMEAKTFPSGRHRNKTYLQVFDNDREFCEMVLKGEKSRFIPEDFLDFVLTKLQRCSLQQSVAERNGIHFVKAMDPKMERLFRDVIGKIDVQIDQVHPACQFTISNGFLGVFYHFFVQKHVHNITNTDGYCKYLDGYTGIFPFPVSDRVVVRQDSDILNFFDYELLAEMQTFLNKHFDNVEIRPMARKFFANILNFKQKNVPEKSILAAVKGIDLKGMSLNDRGDENFNDRFCFAHEKAEYLKTYPRVNHTGVLRYQRMYDMLKSVTTLYRKPCNVPAFKYDTNYLLKLPEINLYELYSLLNVDFLRSDRPEYVYRFKKYLFFFINALNNPSKPVFFIDDALFECLLHYSTYRKTRDDAERLKFELSMLTLVYRRKQTFDENRGTFCIEDSNLKDVKRYFDNFPGIENALVKNEIRTDILESQAFVSTERVAMDVCFRNTVRKHPKDFFELIIHGALSTKKFDRLVIYNAYTGQQTSISMPSHQRSIVEFVRKYNKYDFDEVLPPEKFLTWGHECYYQGEIATWDSRRKFRC